MVTNSEICIAPAEVAASQREAGDDRSQNDDATDDDDHGSKILPQAQAICPRQG